MARTRPLTALLGAALALTLGATTPADAAVTSASITGDGVTLNLDAADDSVTVSAAGGVLVHTPLGNVKSELDWDSAVDGDQTVPADGRKVIVVNAGDGNDSVSVRGTGDEIGVALLNGEGGDDVLTGADTGDTLTGGGGNDILTGGKGGDGLEGGPGNDTSIWNDGDGNDVSDGDAGNDEVEVNGAPITGDTFTVAVDAGRILFRRTNLDTVILRTSSERLQVNGLGGDDSLIAAPGVAQMTLLSVNGGSGSDTISGSDGPDVIDGGPGGDFLNGAEGDDSFVWNDGDGSDRIDGDLGVDDVTASLDGTAGDVVSVQPNGRRVTLARTNLVPFALDIGSIESLHLAGRGGADMLTAGAIGLVAVNVSGGPGNDTITTRGSFDFVLGDEGDDHVDVRDGAPDVARGGEGNDSVAADDVDLFDGFETVDGAGAAAPPPPPPPPPAPIVSPPAAGPPPAVVAPPAPRTTPVSVAIKGGTAKVSKGRVAVRLSCPATSPDPCSGMVVLTAAHAKRAVLARARYSIAPGRSATLKLKLARGTSRLADRKGRIKAVAVASTAAAGAVARSSRGLTLALGRR
jgi:Ca2+-binding RTX toxin-like protein